MGERLKGDVREFLSRYPAGHTHAGQIIGRKAKCHCGREFKQYKVNADWLNSLRKGARDSYLDSCEIRNGDAFQPARCPHCERKNT